MAAQTEVSDTEREQRKAEQDVEQVRQRAARDQQRLDSGVITSPKDLASLQSEIASLAKRQDALETVVLEVMERQDAAQERVTELSAALAALQAKAAEVTSRRDAGLRDADSEAEAVRAERAAVAGTVPDVLLALYDKLRAQYGGIGAARLYQRRCEGCRLELNITELGEVRATAPDTVVRCESCGRILVRTPESGL